MHVGDPCWDWCCRQLQVRYGPRGGRTTLTGLGLAESKSLYRERQLVTAIPRDYLAPSFSSECLPASVIRIIIESDLLRAPTMLTNGRQYAE